MFKIRRPPALPPAAPSTALAALLGALLGAPAARGGDVPRGAEALLDLNALPLLRDGVQAHHVSSFDRAGGNDDGFAGTWSALEERGGEHVILAARGAGCVYTLWFTGPDGGYSTLPWGRLRIYFGSEEKPRVDVEANEFFSGSDPRFPRPLVAGPRASSGGHVSYVPLEFSNGLRITTERRAGFYNAYYQTYRDAEDAVDGWPTGEKLERLRALFAGRGSWRDAECATGPLPEGHRMEGKRSAPPGGAATIADVEGAGAIVEVRVDPLFPPTAEDLRDLRMRIAWDGQDPPAVDVPLGMFFGCGLGEAHVTSLFFGVSSSGHYYNSFPMPFWSRARVDLVNPTARSFGEFLTEVRWIDRPYPRDRAGYLHAQHRREWPTTRGRDYTILEAAGRGSFVGNVLAIHPLAPANKRWWEGDARMFIDGRRTPAIHGTGHEDDYLGGWSNEFLSRPFSLPFHGEPSVGPLTDVGGQLNGDVSLYRVYVPIPFETGIRHGCEHGISNREDYRYSSCAFYYLASATRRVLADELVLGDPASEEVHAFRADGEAGRFEVESTFEGDEGAKPVKAAGRRLEGPFEFKARIRPSNSGLSLRASFDQKEGNRLLEVEVDGERAGEWLLPGANPHRRLREEDWEVPPRLSAGKGEVRIRLRPAAGPFAALGFRVFAYEKKD